MPGEILWRNHAKGHNSRASDREKAWAFWRPNAGSGDLGPKTAFRQNSLRDKIGIYTNRTNPPGDHGAQLRTYISRGPVERAPARGRLYLEIKLRERREALASRCSDQRQNNGQLCPQESKRKGENCAFAGFQRRQTEPRRKGKKKGGGGGKKEWKHGIPGKAASPPNTHASAIYLRVSMGEIKEAV